MLTPAQAIDWSSSGVGAIPSRAACAHLTSSAGAAQINQALAVCPAGQAVELAAGQYALSASLSIPSNVTLRGAGADRTILRATGGAKGPIVSMGSGWVSYRPIRILGPAAARANRLLLDRPSGLAVGMYLVVTETNDPRFVTSAGSEGVRNWCDAEWSPSGAFCRGQIVEITAVAGDSVSFTPSLYSDFTLSPFVVPFRMAAVRAGVEDLQLYAAAAAYDSNFELSACAYCWIKGVASVYPSGDHVNVQWGFHDEIRDSYFSNALTHLPGSHDADIRLALKTTAARLENNIVERTHQAFLLQWGPAGNVIAYNFTTGEFDSRAPYYMIGGVFFHGAHPQFNLLEGNVIAKLDQDSTWGSASHTTVFRNWILGVNRVCPPLQGTGPANCSGEAAHYANQAVRAVQLSYLATANNFLGNVVGSQAMQSLAKAGAPLRQIAKVEYPESRSYDGAAYSWSFGYGSESDSGSGSGCTGGAPPCHRAATSATHLLQGNYTNADHSIHWVAGLSRRLPPSFYLAARPYWWDATPFPATGPDVRGGDGPEGMSWGNPARNCYRNVMGGVDGGGGGPRRFNAAACYDHRTK